MENDRQGTPLYTITLDLNGGELHGITGIITEEYYEDAVITMPKPHKEGYRFTYWKGSSYRAGQKYVVKGDHTFTAQWDKRSVDPTDADGSGPSKDKKNSGSSSGSGTDTGDRTDILRWLTLFTAALTGILFTAFMWRRQS